MKIVSGIKTGNIVLVVAEYSENDLRKIILQRLDEKVHTAELSENEIALYEFRFDNLRLPNDMLEVLKNFLD